MSLITNRVVNFCDMKLTLNCRWSLSEGHLPITVGCWRRGGFEAEKLSPRTKVVGRIHFPKLQNSHEAKTVL